MKQRENKTMKTSDYSSQLDELAELIAWQGYEFWSAQVEAEMESAIDLEQSGAFALSQLEMQEGKSDVLPF
jgi:hypothetical protein